MLVDCKLNVIFLSLITLDRLPYIKIRSRPLSITFKNLALVHLSTPKNHIKFCLFSDAEVITPSPQKHPVNTIGMWLKITTV